MAQVIQLKRSDKCYLCSIRTARRKLNEEAIELNWLDKNIELIQREQFGVLRKLVIWDR